MQFAYFADTTGPLLFSIPKGQKRSAWLLAAEGQAMPWSKNSHHHPRQLDTTCFLVLNAPAAWGCSRHSCQRCRVSALHLEPGVDQEVARGVGDRLPRRPALV